MSRSARIIVGIVVTVLILLVIAFAYIWVTGGSGTPSEATTAEALAPSANLTIFAIVPDESQAQFVLEEDLRGARNTVTGVTQDVAGEVGIDFDNPSASQVGEIRINARTLTTDNEFRNRAIRSQILLSSQDQYEFISFKPTQINGLPDVVPMGEPIRFQIAGDMTIRDTTKPVTFAVTVTPISQARIEGTATATVQRSDFNLEIPSVPTVANVTDEVQLEIDFVATTDAASNAGANAAATETPAS